VLALHVLEHVDDPKTIVKKMYSWLKPGGKAIVVVPNSESLHRRLAVALNLQTHLNTLSKRDKIVGHLEFFSK
jgi:2-polyprenyl-3-methyl-5-hydroxy-6-metoxy-1,4-benzoquinol methylase